MQSENLKKVDKPKLLRKNTNMRFVEDLQNVQLKKVDPSLMKHSTSRKTAE